MPVGLSFVTELFTGYLPSAAVPDVDVDKISSRIFATLRYRDEDPIVEKPSAVIIANYASVTIISYHPTVTSTSVLTIRPLTDDPSFSYEKLVRETWMN